MVGALKVSLKFSTLIEFAVRHPTVSSKLSVSHAIEPAIDPKLAGLTSVDGRLFVLLWPSNCYIHVFDTNHFTLQQETVEIAGLSDYGANGLTSCATNKCLYVSEHPKNAVYKVELERANAVSRWQVADGPMGLSINSACNLLVACRTSGKIQEYNTASRLLVHEIRLQSQNRELQPWHVIQLTCDRFLACCSSKNLSYIDVLELSSKGEVLVSYTKRQLLPSGRNCYGPCHLAYDKSNEHVFLADRDNDRVVAINRLMNHYANELAMPVDGGLKSPSCLYLDESNGQLFIGEFNKCSVTICKVVRVLTTLKDRENLELSGNLVTLKVSGKTRVNGGSSGKLMQTS
jgi:hypothetical protein